LIGQTNGGNSPGLIFGKIIDQSNHNPVEFATIAVFKVEDSLIVNGAIANIEGEFEVEDIPLGNYYVEIDFIGYTKKIINHISISEKNSEFDIGTIQLESFAKNMDEFNVVDEKELVEIKIDKTVYNVSKDPASQGNNGLDMLKTIPSVDVDIEDNISLRNDNSVKVLIDGKPSPIPASQLLKDIPASLIEKIEVITNPSAKYNPEGMSGIINIILKKEKAVGFNGNINGSIGYGNTARYNSSLSLNFRRKKINIYGNIGLYKGEWSSIGNTNRTYLTTDTLYFQELTFDRSGSYTSLWYSGGFDYYVNDKNTFYLEASGWGGAGSNLFNNHYSFLNGKNELQSYSDRVSDGASNYSGQDINIGWQKEFDKDGDHTLDFDFDFSKSVDDGNNNIAEHFFLSDDTETGIPAIQNTKTPGIDYEFEGYIDYVLPVNDSLEIETGINTTITDAQREFYSESNDSLNVIFPDVNLNNEVTYQQTVNAAYVTIGKQFKKIGVKFGLRGENVTTKIKLINTNEEFNKQYTSIFPSVYLTYKLIKKHELKLSYSRRINRPNEWEINPFASYSDPYSLRIGNPDLDPEYINVYELGYLFQGDKITLTPSAYVRQIVDKKTQFSEINNEGILISTYNNSGRLLVKGVEFITRYSPYKWLRLNATLNYSQSKYSDLNLMGTPNTTIDGWSLQLSSSLTFNKGLSMQIYGNYFAKKISIQGTTLPRYGVTMAVRKKILKDKGSLSIRASDIFNTREYNYMSTDLGGYSARSNSKWASRTIYLSFRYSFGTIKMNNNERRESNKSSSGGSLGSGNQNGGN
jgi:outer membrane receptor protein involved in Fe transport